MERSRKGRSSGGRRGGRQGGGGHGGARIPRPIGARMDRARAFQVVSDYGTQSIGGSNSLAKTLSFKFSDMPGGFTSGLTSLFDLFTIDKLELDFIPTICTSTSYIDGSGVLRQDFPLIFVSAMDRSPGTGISLVEEVLTNPDCVTCSLDRKVTRVIIGPKPALPAYVGASGVQYAQTGTQWLSTGNTTFATGSGVNVLWSGMNIGFRNFGYNDQRVQIMVRWFLRVKEQET